eukprot:CAMPEP_0175077924 /NCGR_PEP_ID=MMETSP0052_2-20121109/23739_1 /TAXON_ID=51329 ORGANISM="Polytomella parva, Strain SAG 63-3" /NCGR_SAMPLE_ID=MMETSP0052_2 /ASSEMBLY_ACC=CAM_ASM_000194 /LENGTH=711 /DNA_ID=CAMNT_0016347601 /DNA_START=51 /DNA_END=2189 /DNA_ORIENTATION=-
MKTFSLNNERFDLISQGKSRRSRFKSLCSGACGAILLTTLFLISYIGIVLTLRGASNSGFLFQYSPLGIHIDFSIPPLPSLENYTHDEYGFPKVSAICASLFRKDEQIARMFSHFGTPGMSVSSTKELSGGSLSHEHTMPWIHSLSAVPESSLPSSFLKEYWPLVNPSTSSYSIQTVAEEFAFDSGGVFNESSNRSKTKLIRSNSQNTLSFDSIYPYYFSSSGKTSLSSSQQLCLSLLETRERFRVFKYSTPLNLKIFGGVVAFNRALLVEEYLVHHAAHGIFEAKKPEEANAFLMPMQAYRYTQMLFNSTQKLQVGQEYYSKMVRHVERHYPESWSRRNACDHIFITTHDKGTSYAYKEYLLLNHSLAITNTAEDITNFMPDSAPFYPFKDISTVPSISFRLPNYSTRLGVFSLRALSHRPLLFSFIGRAESHEVRASVFSTYSDPVRHPDVLLREGKTSPGEYMEIMSRTKYCLHLRGTRSQSPRLIEMMYFGCVPVIVADGYYPPLHGVVDWTKIALRVRQEDVYRLKDLILADLPNLGARQEWLRRAVPLFLYHVKPAFGDAFHATMMLTRNHMAKNLARPECMTNAVSGKESAQGQSGGKPDDYMDYAEKGKVDEADQNGYIDVDEELVGDGEAVSRDAQGTNREPLATNTKDENIIPRSILGSDLTSGNVLSAIGSKASSFLSPLSSFRRSPRRLLVSNNNNDSS